MPQRLAHRDLRNRSAEVLRAVQAGMTYEITNHGVVVAILSPPAAPLTLRIRPPRVRRGFADLARVRRRERTEDVLDDLREER